MSATSDEALTFTLSNVSNRRSLCFIAFNWLLTHDCILYIKSNGSNGVPRTQDQYLLGQIEAKAVDADIEVSSVAFIRIKEEEPFCFEDGITQLYYSPYRD